jgi:hypothetical protein
MSYIHNGGLKLITYMSYIHNEGLKLITYMSYIHNGVTYHPFFSYILQFIDTKNLLNTKSSDRNILKI